MKKIGLFCLTSLMLPLASIAGNNEAAANWSGEFYNVMPNRAGVTQNYCEAHSLTKYQAVQSKLLKGDIKSDNGVSAQNINFKDQVKNGLYFHNGKAKMWGKYQGKSWQTTFHYYVQSLGTTGDMQGVWADKDCKGLIKATATPVNN